MRAIRGAITVEENTEQSIIENTKNLLLEMIKQNEVYDIVSILFSATHDLNACFPAKAARELGLNDVPLLCFNEIDVPDSLEKCIRLIMHINTEKSRYDIKHIYLNDAKKLRPDLH